jgi:diguanylate cyclase (GGDEF)-like protein
MLSHAFPIPADEPERLARVASTGLLYTPAEERFDRITRLARQFFGVQSCLISLIDSDQQWFKSRQGLNVACTARDVSFCSHAIIAEDVMVVEDTHADDRFAGNPMVLGAPHVRFYAGCPLLAREGSAVGTLCLLDPVPRLFARHQVQALEDFASWVETELQYQPMQQRLTQLAAHATSMERAAMLDPLTGMWNRTGLDHFFSVRPRVPHAVIVLDLDHFKNVNDTWGHLAGDQVLREVADRIRRTLRPEDFAARFGGEEFVMCVPQADMARAQLVAQRLLAAIGNAPFMPAGVRCDMTASIGVALYDGPDAALTEAFAAADAMLYAAKQSGRNQVRFMLTDSAPSANV